LFKFNIKSETKEIDGVYQFKINFPSFEGLQFVSMYLFKIGESYVLIDAGLSFTDCEQNFFSELENLKISPNDLRFLIITHEHPDHIGIARALKQKNPEIQVVMHKITRDVMKYMTDLKYATRIRASASDASLSLMRFGVSKKLSDKVLKYMTNFRSFTQFHEPDQVLEDNDEIVINSNKLKIIWPPGHSVGHICVFDYKTRYLFSGDHILSRITPHIGAFLPNPVMLAFQSLPQ